MRRHHAAQAQQRACMQSHIELRSGRPTARQALAPSSQAWLSGQPLTGRVGSQPLWPQRSARADLAPGARAGVVLHLLQHLAAHHALVQLLLLKVKIEGACARMQATALGFLAPRLYQAAPLAACFPSAPHASLIKQTILAKRPSALVRAPCFSTGNVLSCLFTLPSAAVCRQGSTSTSSSGAEHAGRRRGALGAASSEAGSWICAR